MEMGAVSIDQRSLERYEEAWTCFGPWKKWLGGEGQICKEKGSKSIRNRSREGGNDAMGWRWGMGGMEGVLGRRGSHGAGSEDTLTRSFPSHPTSNSSRDRCAEKGSWSISRSWLGRALSPELVALEPLKGCGCDVCKMEPKPFVFERKGGSPRDWLETLGSWKEAWLRGVIGRPKRDSGKQTSKPTQLTHAYSFKH